MDDSDSSGMEEDLSDNEQMTDVLEEGRPKIEEFYVLGKQIGQGAFSIVKEAVNKATGERVAVKSIKTRLIKSRLLMREIEIMKKVGSHPSILKLYEVYETRKHLYLVLELVTGGALMDQIVAGKHYSEKDASSIVRQIISAVAYLHANGIAHRDLKPQNLLYARSNSDDIVVADFGLSKMFGGGQYLETCCGSPEYVAPEVLDSKPYDKACDLWSIGVITYVLLTNRFPFWGSNNGALYENIRRAEYGWPEGVEISIEAQNLIRHLLEKQPEKRYTAEQALAHPWVTGHIGFSTKKTY